MRVERPDGSCAGSSTARRFLTYDDPTPLEGAGHDRFGFSSWDADVFFDRLDVQPL